jgi:hypothetical protein
MQNSNFNEIEFNEIEYMDDILLLNEYIVRVDTEQLIGEDAKYFGVANELLQNLYINGYTNDSSTLIEVMKILEKHNIEWNPRI